MTETISENQISVWVDAALENKNIKNYKIKVTGTSEKGEGYATDVIFLKVAGSKKTSEEDVELDLVLKVAKDFKAFDKGQLEEAYDRELFIYDRVFPEYRIFQESKKHQNIFNSGPTCIKTLNDGKQVLVLENLRTQGYRQYNRELPMNVDHIKIVLKNYALFHAIGFAFRDQRKLEFANLTKNYTCLHKLISDGPFRPMFQIKATKTINVVKEFDEKLANKMNETIEQGIPETLDELFDTVLEESVITHGDCWNSNFLFKYDDPNKMCPSNVAILDWQVSSFASPLIDVAYFMFIVSSKNEVAQFDSLLEFYYENLSKNISELGSDPNKLFPRSKFQAHWKMFSTMGYLFAISFLDMVLCDKNDAPDLADCNQEELINTTMNTTAKNRDLYIERVLALSRYYVKLHT